MSHLGEFTAHGHPDVWSDVRLDPDGVLPMLALVATAPEVAALHAGRGVPADISAATLTDLGQQVWVHRLTYGTFGLHTHGWLDHRLVRGPLLAGPAAVQPAARWTAAGSCPPTSLAPAR